jgi:hypothetical protein
VVEDVGEHRRVTSKSPAERALDLFVYAPLGLLVSVRDLLPELVERGREQLSPQVNTAHAIGKLAVKQGSKQAGKAFEKARASAETSLTERLEAAGVDTGTGNGVATTTEPAREPVPSVRPAPAPVRPEPTEVRAAPRPAAAPTPAAAEPVAAPEPVRAAPSPTPDAPAPLAGTLAIPAYDSLSASQVVPRLSGLSPTELEAVRDYEAAHRGRKTILNRVAQLQAS